MPFPVKPRMSSTLILAVRNQLSNQAPSSFGYKLLMVQRSSTSKFMPNNFVFPGGISEKSDFSNDWLELIGQRELPVIKSMINSSFYTSYASHSGNSLPAHIGFRICAIRETFEESGVLLVKPLQEKKKKVVEPEHQHINLSHDELQTWRKRVNDDAALFLQLCREIQCAPDIWSLYEWSNWITPVINNVRRYNTMFYLTFLDNKPEIKHDGTETINSVWVDPEESLHPGNKFNIAPPQFYEMTRLCRFTDLDDLKAVVTSLKGVREWEPVPIITKNGEYVSFLPQDLLYESMKTKLYKHCQNIMEKAESKDLKKIPPVAIPQTTEELCVKDKDGKSHRIVIDLKTRQFRVECNLTTTHLNMPTPHSKFNKFGRTLAKL